MNYTEAVMNCVQVDKRIYEQLLEDQKLLHALRAAGVDNWSGWDDAISLMENE